MPVLTDSASARAKSKSSTPLNSVKLYNTPTLFFYLCNILAMFHQIEGLSALLSSFKQKEFKRLSYCSPSRSGA
ncbi:hypothetical protein DM15PD_14530 [Aristophania vespae]|nr:hypothetical protein DM15PD_14530 [Aristophania vespae]